MRSTSFGPHVAIARDHSSSDTSGSIFARSAELADDIELMRERAPGMSGGRYASTKGSGGVMPSWRENLLCTRNRRSASEPARGVRNTTIASPSAALTTRVSSGGEGYDRR